MDFDLTEHEREWRDEVRGFLAANVTDDLLEEVRTIGPDEHGPEVASFRQKIGERGWYGINWPVEFGGLGLGGVDLQIILDEFESHGVPCFDNTHLSVAPMIAKFGTEKNKADWLPRISRAEVTCALAYSEPDAGTDLANLRTQAVTDGSDWVINGTKLWNSRAQSATHEWLCVRTDPSRPRHRGLSIFMVPIDSPGIEVHPIYTWGDHRTNETTFTDVRVPAENLIGGLNEGWTYITGALDFERAYISSSARLRLVFDALVEYCCTRDVGGSRLADDPDVRRRLAELDLEVLRLMNLETASVVEDGGIPTLIATQAKITASELRQKIADWGLQILGRSGQLDEDQPDAPLRGRLERLYRESPLVKFGGGTNEVLRDIIAQRHYGLPSYGRATHKPSSAA